MIGRKSISCREVVEILTAYLEGRLSRRDRRRVEAHLAVCPHCTEYLKQMRQMIRTLGLIRSDEIPTGVRADLMEAFRGWRQAR